MGRQTTLNEKYSKAIIDVLSKNLFAKGDSNLSCAEATEILQYTIEQISKSVPLRFNDLR